MTPGEGAPMTLAIVHTRAGLGLEAPEVQVEVHLANGLPGMTLVGLPETAVKESRERVRSALVNAGFDYPLRRITLNLAPPISPRRGAASTCPLPWGCYWPRASSLRMPSRRPRASASWRWMAACGRFTACCPWPWPPAVPVGG